MDQYVVPQSAGGGAGKQKALRGIRDPVVGPAGLPLVFSSLCPCFGSPTQ